MKTETFDAETNKAWTKPIATIKYKVTYEAYETPDEIRAANDWPTDKEVVEFKNAQRKNNERQKAQVEEWKKAGHVKPTLENDDQLKLKTMYNVFIAVKGTTDAEARAKASAAIGVAWDE